MIIRSRTASFSNASPESHSQEIYIYIPSPHLPSSLQRTIYGALAGKRLLFPLGVDTDIRLGLSKATRWESFDSSVCAAFSASFLRRSYRFHSSRCRKTFRCQEPTSHLHRPKPFYPQYTTHNSDTPAECLISWLLGIVHKL